MQSTRLSQLTSKEKLKSKKEILKFIEEKSFLYLEDKLGAQEKLKFESYLKQYSDGANFLRARRQEKERVDSLIPKAYLSQEDREQIEIEFRSLVEEFAPRPKEKATSLVDRVLSWINR